MINILSQRMYNQTNQLHSNLTIYKLRYQSGSTTGGCWTTRDKDNSPKNTLLKEGIFSKYQCIHMGGELSTAILIATNCPSIEFIQENLVEFEIISVLKFPFKIDGNRPGYPV